jgi:hypothetical protein
MTAWCLRSEGRFVPSGGPRWRPPPPPPPLSHSLSLLNPLTLSLCPSLSLLTPRSAREAAACTGLGPVRYVLDPPRAHVHHRCGAKNDRDPYLNED